MQSQRKLLIGRWICPMDRPPIRDGGVAIEGERIVAVGDARELRRQFCGAAEIDYGPAAVLPGLINAHTHLELTRRPRIDFDGDIAGWLLRQRPRADLTPEQRQAEVQSATRAGVAQCLKFGVTCVGDISQQPQWTRPILAASPLRGTSFGEVLGLGQSRGRTSAMRERATDSASTNARLRVGISPHSPYTLEWPTLQNCVADAILNHLPLAMHLAEWRPEREFLSHEAGPFRQMWETLGLWDDQVQILHKPPILLASALKLLEQNALLAHVNDITHCELELLASGNASVVFCPRTHAYFRHPSHRWQQMLAEGINVAIGTDSCASSPDLNLVDELRLLRRRHPTVAAEVFWSLVTTRAAHALHRAADCGSLSIGKCADFAIFSVGVNEPLASILDSVDSPIATWIGGRLAAGDWPSGWAGVHCSP